MGKEKKEEEKDEREATTTSSFPTLKFPFLPLPAGGNTLSSDRPPSPPLQTSVSVPFKWEEQPGKPRPCTDIIPLPVPGPIPLEPPPCWNTKMTKMPSPTAVLDGPYPLSRPKFSSFRFIRRRDESFDSTSGGSPYSSLDHHHHHHHDALLGNNKTGGGGGQKGKLSLFGRGLRFKIGKKEAVDEGSFGFSSPSSASEGRMRRNGSFSTLTQSQPTSPRLCATIYERLKQAVPWKSTRKSRKDEAI